MTTSPWISVKDRLPEKNPIFPNRYLVAKGNIVLEAMFDQRRWWGISNSATELCPTHWMPLPDPPKPEDPFEAWWNSLERPNQRGMDKRRVVAHLDTFVYEAEARAIWDAAIASQKTDKQQP